MLGSRESSAEKDSTRRTIWIYEALLFWRDACARKEIKYYEKSQMGINAGGGVRRALKYQNKYPGFVDLNNFLALSFKYEIFMAARTAAA